MSSVDVSVLLVSWNTRDETRACLDSLPAAVDDDLRYEVVAVDNGSRDGSAELLAAYPGVRLLRNDRNLGFAAAVNQAHRLATGRLVLLLNSDVRLHPGALSTLARFLGRRPDVAGVSPRYLNPDGTAQQHYVQFPSFPAMIALFTAARRLPGFRRALWRFQLRGEDLNWPRPLASGSCLLLRRSVLSPDQLLDERFPIYWNDAVLARSLHNAGHSLWMIPDATVTHTRGASCRLLGPAIRHRHLLGGLVRYQRLTQPAHRLPLFRAVVLLDHLTRRLTGRPVPLRLRTLWATLRGELGPLPDGDIRDWVIRISDPGPGPATPVTVTHPAGSSAGPAAGPLARSTADPFAAGPLASGFRVLDVAPPAGRRLVVRRIAPAHWQLTPPALLPVGHRLPAVRRINLRWAAGPVREWLDQYPGARLLHLTGPASHPMVGRLGEDELVELPVPPSRRDLVHD